MLLEPPKPAINAPFPIKKKLLESSVVYYDCGEIQKQIKCDLNISYGPGERDILDIFGTDLEKDAPVFIFVHGGYWQEQSITRDTYWFIAKKMCENNIKTIYVEYPLCPYVTLEKVVASIETAMNKCLEYAKFYQSRGIHLAGHSAGAHLIACLFEKYIPSLPELDRNLFKSAFLLSGIYDIIPLIDMTINGPLKLDEARAAALSPLYRKLSADVTTFFVVVGQHDGPAFVEQASKMQEHLSKLKMQVKYLYLESTDHFDILEKLLDDDYELTKLILTNVCNKE